MDYTREQLEEALYVAADRYGIRHDVAWRQINQESRFNPKAISPAGARGIAQFMPGTAARFGLANLFDPIASFDAWGRYMRSMLDMFGERYDLALAGYNSGENRSEYKAAAREGRPINWAVFNTPKLRGVYTETRNYVNTILGGLPDGSATQPSPSDLPDRDPGPNDNESPLMPWLAIGAALVVAWVFLAED